MEVLLVDAFTSLALKVFKTIDAQNLVVRKEIVSLQIEEVLTSGSKLSLEPDEC